MEMKQPIAIGIESYKTLIENNYYYVDKTWMLKELMDQKGCVNLFTRPRRFGKTLTLSMIQTFFEDERTYAGEKIENSRYFDGKKILTAGENYTSQMGTYPVIKLSLKSAKQPDFQMAYKCLKNEIFYEYDRHKYVLNGDQLSEKEKEKYRQILEETADAGDYATALKWLSFYLKKYHEKNVIILIDEYDVPLENAYFRDFYDQMVDFIRSLFESALKTNDALEFAIVTGCLRISKESIFTGLNNLEMNSI
ncbi:MAG: AAA family ATPase, partial [Lachnospiraceae bacterium]